MRKTENSNQVCCLLMFLASLNEALGLFDLLDYAGIDQLLSLSVIFSLSSVYH